jgi:large subunit ribosomal protein L32
MPHPKKRHTKAAKGQRRSHHALKETNFTTCSKCKEKVLPHRVCQKCGSYNSKQVIEIKDKKGKKKKQEGMDRPEKKEKEDKKK